MTPSQAVRKGKCPHCLGIGWVFNVALVEETPCSACVGVGTLEAMWEHASGAYLAPDEYKHDDDRFEGC